MSGTALLPPPPAGALRLLDGYDERARRHPALLCERILADGDRDDVRWLLAALPAPEVARWLQTVGVRRLPSRVVRYWATVLGVEASPAAPSEVWPL